MYMNFGVLHVPLPKKILHLVSYKMIDFTSFLKSKLISIYDFWGCIENWQGNYFLMFFPTEAGDFTCLAGLFSFMWEILHACRESGRNSVQAGDSLSMRESWKPWVICNKNFTNLHKHIIVLFIRYSKEVIAPKAKLHMTYMWLTNFSSTKKGYVVYLGCTCMQMIL